MALIGFAGLLLTGSILFTAEASHVILNPVFQFKLGLIALGLLNVAWFEFFTAPTVRDLPPLQAAAVRRASGGHRLARDLACGRGLRADDRVFLNALVMPRAGIRLDSRRAAMDGATQPSWRLHADHAHSHDAVASRARH